MSTDNHLDKFKQFAESQVKYFESKANRTDRENQFLLNQKAFVNLFDDIVREKEDNIYFDSIENSLETWGQNNK